MKIDTKSLSSACARIVPLAGKRTTLPILNHLRIESKGSMLEISASNLISHQLVKVPCEGELSPVCVQAKMFSQLVGSGNGSVELANIEGAITVKSGWSSKLHVLDAAEFPAVPADLKGVGVPVTDLADSIEGVSWAAMDEKRSLTDGRYHLAGVFVKITPKSMLVTATDAKALCLFERGLICSQFEAIIPIASVESMVWALRQKNAVIAANKQSIGVTHDDGSFHCNLLEGQFPDVMRVVPKTFDPIATVDREAFVDHLSNCLIVNPEEERGGGDFLISTSPGKVVVSVESRSGSNYDGEMDGGIKESKSRYSFKLFMPAIKSCTLDKVTLVQNAPLEPMCWKSGDFTTVIAGLRLE